MAGILDSKERVMDFIITQEGKRQAGFGELRVKFASFTDYHTFYETSGSQQIPSLADDATKRIFFEPYSRYQDIVVPELEAGSSLRPFRTSDFTVQGNTVASGTFQTGFIARSNIQTGSDLPAIFPEVLNGLEKNFTDQKIISTIDLFSLTNNFSISPSSCNFEESNVKFQKTSGKDSKIRLEDVASIFNDRRFSHFPNFKYLPPQNLPFPGQLTGSNLASYPKLDEKDFDGSFTSISDVLQGCPSKVFEFSETSRFNNFVCQAFETSEAGVDKLSVIDFGVLDDNNVRISENLTTRKSKRVLFLGKIRRDSTGAETFLCLFTVVIE